jgi:hypothetical protein
VVAGARAGRVGVLPAGQNDRRPAIDTADRLPAAEPGEAAADDAWWQACAADHDADVAYEQFSAAWGEWRRGPEISAEPDEPEAGS